MPGTQDSVWHTAATQTMAECCFGNRCRSPTQTNPFHPTRTLFSANLLFSSYTFHTNSTEEETKPQRH